MSKKPSPLSISQAHNNQMTIEKNPRNDKTSHSKKLSGVFVGTNLQKRVPAFLQKLSLIIAAGDRCGWKSDGLSFYIDEPKTFAKEVLPRYFKTKNFASFVRQLHFYDFHKSEMGSNATHAEFSHPYFQRDAPNLIALIRRKTATDFHDIQAATEAKQNSIHKDELVNALKRSLVAKDEQLARYQSKIDDLQKQQTRMMKNLKSDILIKDQKLAKYEERIAEYECSTKTYETELQLLREKLESTTIKLETSNGSSSGNETPRGTNNNNSSSSLTRASMLTISGGTSSSLPQATLNVPRTPHAMTANEKRRSNMTPRSEVALSLSDAHRGSDAPLAHSISAETFRLTPEQLAVMDLERTNSSSSVASLLSIPDEVFDRSIWQYESGTDLVHQNSFNMGSHHHAYGNMEATQNLEPLFAEEEHHSKKRKFNLITCH